MVSSPRFIPAIRSMQEARDVLAEVLDVEARRMQIVMVMQKIMLCRTQETRRFLGDAMAGLLEGGLADMRRKRREAIEAVFRYETARFAPDTNFLRDRQAEPAPVAPATIEAPRVPSAPTKLPEKGGFGFETVETVDHEPYELPEPAPEEAIGVKIPGKETAPVEPPVMPSFPDEIKEIEDLGTELDALSLAAVAREIFPDLKTMYEPWEVGRAIYMDENNAREAVLQGARLKDKERETQLAPAFEGMKRLIESRRPSWARSVTSIRRCVDAHFTVEAPRRDGPTAQQVFDVIAMSDQRALEVLSLVGKSSDRTTSYIADVRRKLDRLMSIEDQVR